MQLLCSATAWNLAGMKGAGAAESAWIAEMGVCYSSVFEINTRCIALAAQSRLDTTHRFLDVMERIMVLMEAVSSQMHDGMSARLEWMRAHVRRHGHGTMQRCMVFTAPKGRRPEPAAGGPAKRWSWREGKVGDPSGDWWQCLQPDRLGFAGTCESRERAA